ncbi:MAG: hypothetical protein RH860_16845 [Cytophagales bacterium]
MKKIILTLVLVIGAIFIFNACNEDDEVDPCNCPASSPWSKNDIENCYATKAACESAEGGTCIICN